MNIRTTSRRAQTHRGSRLLDTPYPNFGTGINMPDLNRAPVSNIGTPKYEPFISAGQPFGEVHWLRTESGGAGCLYAGLWKHGCATFDYVFPGDETFHMLEGKVRI